MKNKVTQIDRYRSCFNTFDGQFVLGHLLCEAGVFDDDLKTSEEIAVENFAKKILKNLGVYELSTVDSFVNGIFRIPVIERKK